MNKSLASHAIVLAGALVFVAQAHAQTVTTLAGSGAVGSADGNGSQASFASPQGVAVDAAGNVYVADTGSGKIRRISPGGDVTTAATGLNVTSMAGVAVDRTGNIYVADAGDLDDGGGGKILKVTPAGEVTTIAGQDTLFQVANPGGIAVDSLGNLYFTDTHTLTNNGLTRYGLLVEFVGGASARILVTNLQYPTGITVDGAGGVYVAESIGERILRLAPDGTVTTVAGSGTAGSSDGPGAGATFSFPAGLALDRSGDLYVADAGNNTIRKITPGGAVTTLAGTGAAGDEDGPAGAAAFNFPYGVALDAAGNLYVADAGNNLIRKISGATTGCGVGCTTWTIPSVAHGSGADGSFWTSDLTVYNRGSVPLPFTLKFLGNSRDGTTGPEKTLSLDPLQTVTYADVLSSVFGIANDAGALEVLTSSDQLTVRSRTFTAAAGGTVGDGMPAVRRNAFFTDQTSPSPVLTGLTEDDRFRANLILVNGTAAPLVVHVAVTDSSGAPIGGRDYTLPPVGMIQDSRFLTREDFGGQPRTDVTVTLSSLTPGAAFTASAVVIDNASNAPTTVLPQ